MIKRYTRPEMGAIWTDEAKYGKWLDVEIAVCEALAFYGYIPKDVPSVLKKKAKFDTERVNEIEKVVKHDVIAFLTNVAENVGSKSRYVHYGMTSSDVLDTAFALQIKDASKLILKELDRLIRVLKKQAGKYKYTMMIGRSHGIHAEPVTFGFKLAVFYEEFKRNRERFKIAAENIRYGKISGAVGTFANIDPKVEKKACSILGLKPEPISTQIIQRDRHAEYMAVLAIIASSLDKLAVEMRHLQRTEVREVEEFFSKGQKGSSAMPHKRNPVTSEKISGLARLIRGNFIAALENIPLWHERDISHSSVERVIFPDSTILMDYMLHSMANLAENMRVFKDKMEENLNISRGMVFSQALMLKMIKKGVTREDAYTMVQRSAMRVWDEKISLLGAVLENDDIKAVLSEDEIRSVFDYAYYTKNIDKIFKRLGI